MKSPENEGEERTHLVVRTVRELLYVSSLVKLKGLLINYFARQSLPPLVPQINYEESEPLPREKDIIYIAVVCGGVWSRRLDFAPLTTVHAG